MDSIMKKARSLKEGLELEITIEELEAKIAPDGETVNPLPLPPTKKH